MTKLSLLLFTVGCVTAADETSSLEQAGKCPPSTCGLNSGAVSDGGFFHELNLDGLPNDAGYSLDHARKNFSRYELHVINGRLIAQLTHGIPGAPTLLQGTALDGLELRLRKEVDGETIYRTLSIESVARTTNFWAKRLDGAPTPTIETYRFFFNGDGAHNVGALLCQNGALLLDPSSPIRAMPEHHALLFEGERIDVESLTIKPTIEPRWFNIGCAETALAKMHLNGHTRAAQAAGFSNTILERQTFLKMMTADYCGVGAVFTVGGQPLRWTDDDGTLTVPWHVSKELEARWTPQGASCLNTPRVLAHPTDASEEAFDDVEMLIERACASRGISRPPPCGTIAPIHHLTSWNPIFSD